MTAIAKVTRKGQVTIPKKIRDILQSDVLEFEKMDDNTIVIRPVKSVGGSLKKYAKKYLPLKQIRDKVWEEVTLESGGKTT